MASTPFATRRILIVGDVLADRDFAVRMLETGGYRVEFASDIMQALVAVNRTAYALVLVPMDSADADVVRESTAKMQQMATAPIPVVAVTDQSTRDAVREWPAGRLSECIAGPLGTVRLLEIVERHARPGSHGDTDVAALAAGYLAARRNDVASAATLLAHGDLDGIRRLAHRIKGTGGSYGFGELTDVAGQLESAAQAGDSGAVHALLDALDATVTQLSAAVPPTRNEDS